MMNDFTKDFPRKPVSNFLNILNRKCLEVLKSRTSKSCVPRALRFSCQGPPAKRSEKAMGTRMVRIEKFFHKSSLFDKDFQIRK